MNVTLTPDAEQFLRTKLAAGEYPSADVVINEGLRVLEQREKWKREISSKIDEGLEQAEAGQMLTAEEAEKERKVRKLEILAKRGTLTGVGRSSNVLA